MSTAELRNQIIQLVQSTTDESKLKVIFNALNDDHDWWDDLTEEQKERVQKGAAQADRGEFVDASEVQHRVDLILGRA